MDNPWISAGAQFVATIIASAVSVWIAIYVYSKGFQQNQQDKINFQKANTASAIAFLRYAAASLLYLCPGSVDVKCPVKQAKIELKKISSVNRELKDIKANDVTSEFLEDLQNCKIVLQIIELEIQPLIDDMSGDSYRSDCLLDIDIERRFDMINKVVERYSH